MKLKWYNWHYHLHQIMNIGAEEQKCPRTVEGPFTYNDEKQYWDRGARWSKIEVLADWVKRNITQKGKFFGGTAYDYKWKPRTCSYCGGIHPEDAMSLLREGWRAEPTTKSYKAYMSPPEGYKSPIPCVKIYFQHFSNEQYNKFVSLTKHPQN